MTKDKMRTGANPEETKPPTAPPAAFDVATFLEQQLAEGLALVRAASELATGINTYYAKERNGAMSAGARLVMANTRSAETLARLQENKSKEQAPRQIAEAKPATKPAPQPRGNYTEGELSPRTYAPEARAFLLAGKPSAEVVAEHEALEAERIAEGRPIDENTWWLRRYRERLPMWAELEEAEAELAEAERSKAAAA